MGIYVCFLGSARTNGHLVFLRRPEFIYFGFWIILIMLGLVYRHGDGVFADLIIVGRNGFLMAWTSVKFCSQGMERGSYGDDGEGILQKLSKQFLIVLRLQGCVWLRLSYCAVMSFYFIFRIFIILSESRHKFMFGE